MAVVVLQSVWRGYLRHRFAWLFAALLFAIGVHPGVQMFAPEANFVAVVLAVSLIAAIASVAREPGFKALTALGAAFVVLQAVRSAIGGDVVSLIGEGVWIVTCLLALAALARQAVRRGAVDGERIFAALDAYLLAGLVFGVAYAILEQHWPEAFGSAAAIEIGRAHV